MANLNGGATGSIAGDVAFPLQQLHADFCPSDEITDGGTISGQGMLVQQGPGNLILTGTNT